jgi:hypothetical protein
MAAQQPGMSGYFDYDPSRGGIVPHIYTPPQVAEQADSSLGQIAGSLFPRNEAGGRWGQGYEVPNDQGGFFTMADLYRGQRQGVPAIGSYQSDLPSTNNWRLLGKGPGWIQRNGFLIDTQSPSTRFGYRSGAFPTGGVSAEQYVPFNQLALGSGASFGLPNLLSTGVSPSTSGWPGATEWTTKPGGWLTS